MEAKSPEAPEDVKHAEALQEAVQLAEALKEASRNRHLGVAVLGYRTMYFDTM